MTITQHFDGDLNTKESLSQHIALMVSLRVLLIQLFAKIHAQALKLDFDNPQFHRMIRTAARITRQLLQVHLYVYQTQSKSNMLADPLWRGRVIAQLGGYHSFARWTRRFIFARQKQSHNAPKPDVQRQPQRVKNPQLNHHNKISGRSTAHGNKISHQMPPSRSDGRIQFRLPPLPRAFYGRVSPVTKTRSHTSVRRSPFDTPIIITPAELMPEAFGPAGAKPHPTHTPTTLSRDEIVAMIEALAPPQTPPQPP